MAVQISEAEGWWVKVMDWSSCPERSETSATIAGVLLRCVVVVVAFTVLCVKCSIVI